MSRGRNSNWNSPKKRAGRRLQRSLHHHSPKSGELQRVKISDHFLEFLAIELVAEARHHISSLNNGLGYVLVRGSKAAGKIFLLKQVLQAGTIVAMGRIRGMAIETIDVVDLASA